MEVIGNVIQGSKAKDETRFGQGYQPSQPCFISPL
jgi:hypothetical protein